MPDITTSLNAQIDRVIDDVIDSIAKDGLVLLEKTVTEAGFSKSPYLKDYKIEAHVANKIVSFQIILGEDSIEIDEDVEREFKRNSDEQKKKTTVRKPRIYIIEKSRIRRIMRDVRKTAQDRTAESTGTKRTVKTPEDRKAESETFKVQNPRSVTIDLKGKIKVKFKRSVTQLPDGKFKYPKNVATEGVFEHFLKDLEYVIESNFLPKFFEMMEKSVG